MRGMTVLALSAQMSLVAPASAEEASLDADAAAGKVIFERTNNNGGCIRCHGADARGSEVNTSLTGNNIQGRTAEEVRLAIMAFPMMWNVKISDEELELVEAYLMHLHKASN